MKKFFLALICVVCLDLQAAPVLIRPTQVAITTNDFPLLSASGSLYDLCVWQVANWHTYSGYEVATNTTAKLTGITNQLNVISNMIPIVKYAIMTNSAKAFSTFSGSTPAFTQIPVVTASWYRDGIPTNTFGPADIWIDDVQTTYVTVSATVSSTNRIAVIAVGY